MPGTPYDPATGRGTNYLKPFLSDVKSLASRGMQKLGLSKPAAPPQTGMGLMGQTESSIAGRSRSYKGDSGDVDVVK